MRSRIVVVFILAVWPATAAASEPTNAAFDAILQETLAAWHAPGIAAAIIRDDKVVYLNGVGVREAGSDRKVTPDTLFAIGSCTKAFTATALALLVDEGKADWNDPVRKHLPWFRLDDPLADRDVRVHDLLCHRIGLSRHDMLWYRAPWSIEESVRRMAYLERSCSFRSTYDYNNLAYLAAGLVIGSIAGQSWNDFVEARLFQSIGMKHAVFTSGEAKKTADHADPHGHDAAGQVVVIPWYDDDKQIRASGSIKANVRDLSRWLRFQLGRGKLEGKQILAADTLEETHAPRIPVPLTDADHAAGATQASYALGWHISEYRGHAVHEHGGAVEGFRARIILAPRDNLGIVLLTNLEDMEIVQAAGNNLLDHLLGLEKKDWNAFFAERRQKTTKESAERMQKRLNSRVPGTKPSHDLDTYVGIYHEPAYGTVRIVREGAALRLNWSSFQLHLSHFHYDTFLTPTNDRHVLAALRAETVVFTLDEEGEVGTLRFLDRTFARKKSPKK